MRGGDKRTLRADGTYGTGSFDAEKIAAGYAKFRKDQHAVAAARYRSRRAALERQAKRRKSLEWMRTTPS